MQSITTLLASNPYPGRGIVAGQTPDGKHAALAYFVMGRSAQSRNRMLVERDGAVYTKAINEKIVVDPSLIIYPALRVIENHTIISNGDQTNTIHHFLSRGRSFEEALQTRSYEPDEPNYTPRVSALITLAKGTLSYRMSILRERRGTTMRSFFDYAGIPGEGHLVHTYLGDGYPLPAFEGEPFSVGVMNDPEDWTQLIWFSLNSENRVALLTRFISLEDGTQVTSIMNERTPVL
ncbi:MAG: IMP cyclohydrolase [Oscillospiraceae bacterium]|jgi:hypothetical protein|nr:IMP cyclohydrolase [Oscillospiraceae bacterium]